MSEDAHGKEWDEQHPHICVPGEEEIHEEPTMREIAEELAIVAEREDAQDLVDAIESVLIEHFTERQQPPRNCMTCDDCEHARPDSGGPFGTDYVCGNEHVCAGYVTKHKRATLHIVNIDGEPVAFVGPDYGCVHMEEK